MSLKQIILTGGNYKEITSFGKSVYTEKGLDEMLDLPYLTLGLSDITALTSQDTAIVKMNIPAATGRTDVKYTLYYIDNNIPREVGQGITGKECSFTINGLNFLDEKVSNFEIHQDKLDRLSYINQKPGITFDEKTLQNMTISMDIYNSYQNLEDATQIHVEGAAGKNILINGSEFTFIGKNEDDIECIRIPDSVKVSSIVLKSKSTYDKVFITYVEED